MTHLLEWRDAARRDRRAFELFTCTDEPLRAELSALGRKRVHPKMWEYEVQEMIWNARPPLHRRYRCRVGCDDEGLAAVSVSEELQQGELYELNFAAVATRLRGRGGGYALEMMRDMLSCIEDRCVSLGVSRSTAEVFGYIHPRNGPSQRMCRTLGLAHDADIDGLQVWRMDLPLPSAD